MFASDLKILTLSATSNVTAPKNHHNIHHHNHQNNNNTQQKTLNSPKLKYLTTTTAIPTTATSNKYHNSGSSNKSSKKHHNSNHYSNGYNNSNNNNINSNTTSSLNRKKYYQQQQKQHLNTNYNSNNNNNKSSSNNNNNNSALAKNQNITVPTTQVTSAATTVDPFILTPKALTTEHILNECQDLYNNNIITINNNNNTTKDYSIDSSSISQLKQSPAITTSTAATNQNITTSTNGKQNKSHSHHSNCNSCWSNYNKLQQQTVNNKVKQSTTIGPYANGNSSDFQEFTAKVKNSCNGSAAGKKKSYWKNQNNNILNLDSKNKAQQNQVLQASLASVDASKLSDQNSDQLFILNGVGGVTKNKTVVISKYQQIPCKTLAAALSTSTTAMTTALATTAAAASNSSTTNSPPTASSEPSAASPTKPKANVVANATTTTTATATTPTPPISSRTTSTSLAEEVVATATITTTTTPPIATVSSSLPTAPTSPPNSYSLDFLHSVGVQMTGGANIAAALKASNNNSNTSSNVNSMPSRKTNYNFANVRQNRYLTGNGGSGGGQQHHGNHYQHHENHYHHHHHHHQPQQLTIASFMQKELTDSFATSGNNNSNNNNNYENQTPQPQFAGQTQRYQNYYQQYQQQHQQQQQPQQQHHHQQTHNYTSLSHAFNVVANEARYVSNGGNIVGRQSYHNICNSNSSSGGGGGGGNQQHNSRQNQQNNAMNHNQQNQQHQQPQQSSLHYQQQNKKPVYASSSNSSCSSSSSSSTSSISSQTSATSIYHRQQHQQHGSSKSSSSNQNLTIETLPAKSHYGASHRGQRLHQQNQQHHHHHHTHQNYHHHQPQQHHHQQLSSSTAPTTPQNQNFYNLTYIATDSLAVPPSHSPATSAATVSSSNLTVRACSPCSPVLSVKGDNPALLLSLNHHHQHQQQQQQQHQNSNSSRYYQPHQSTHFTQQQHYHNNQSKMLSSASASPSVSPTPPPPPTIICCSQLDEASTNAAAAMAAAISNESLHSAAATSSISNSIIAGNDYDSDSTSSTHSTSLTETRQNQRQQHQQQHQQHQQQQVQKYKQLKSSSLSSSSSASSTTSASSAHENVVAPPMLQTPLDFTYTFSLQPFPQHFSNQQILSPQQQHHYRNGVVSLINLTSPNNYSEEDVNSLPHLHHHHPQQQQQIYFTSGEHLNVAAAAASANSGYWSPSPNSMPNSNFIYSTASNIFTSVAAPLCAPSTTAISPRLSERDESQQQLQQPSEHHIPSNQFKRSQVTASTSTLQRNLQLNSGTAMRLRGRSLQNQPQQQPQQALQHAFQQSNLFYGGNSQHLRSSSTSSARDFFSHTPPDRFLARAHLVEAKEMPHTLLNNSKWDMLSQGIWDKFVCSQQTEETFKQKMRLWRYLYIFIKNTYPRYGLYLVGSTISGFGADTSDVDMCLVSRSPSTMEPRQEALLNLNALRDCLAKSGEFENFNLIEAKVPILRFRDRVHQLEVDLNYNNCVGIKNTHLLYCYSQLDWRLRPLVLVTKLWAQYHNINNAKNMTISSYSLVLMVIHFLQYAVNPSVLPCLHDMFPEKFPLLRSNDFGCIDMNESIGPHESKNTQTIGELFLNFLEYYSCFDYTQFAISIRTGGLMSINVCRQAKSLKNDIHQWKELCIEEPFDLTNTARSVYDFETFERVKAVFVASWRILQETLDINAVFSPIPMSPTSMLTQLSATHENLIDDLTPRRAKSVGDIQTTTESNDAADEEKNEMAELIDKDAKYSSNTNNNNNNNNSQNNNNSSSTTNNSRKNLTALIS